MGILTVGPWEPTSPAPPWSPSPPWGTERERTLAEKQQKVNQINIKKQFYLHYLSEKS